MGMFKYLLLLVICTVLPAQAAQVVLAWEYKEQPKVQINGFRVYYGKFSKKNTKEPANPENETDPKPYDKVQRITDPKARRATIKALGYGKFYFRMITTTDAGSTSLFSEEAFVEIRPLDPPSGVEIIITITP